MDDFPEKPTVFRSAFTKTALTNKNVRYPHCQKLVLAMIETWKRARTLSFRSSCACIRVRGRKEERFFTDYCDAFIMNVHLFCF